jgi:putative transposase
VVERCINRLKQWRGLATCEEKRALNYRAMLVLAARVCPAPRCHAPAGSGCELAFFVPRLKRFWADAAYRGKELAEWRKATGSWELDIVVHETGTRDFAVQPQQ